MHFVSFVIALAITGVDAQKRQRSGSPTERVGLPTQEADAPGFLDGLLSLVSQGPRGADFNGFTPETETATIVPSGDDVDGAVAKARARAKIAAEANAKALHEARKKAEAALRDAENVQEEKEGTKVPNPSGQVVDTGYIGGKTRPAHDPNREGGKDHDDTRETATSN